MMKKHMLIQGLNYGPDEIGIAKYTTEMAEWFVKQGWKITIVTSHPYYPEWRNKSGHSFWSYRVEEKNGVRIWRCPLYVPARQSGIKRLLHLASFALSSMPLILFEVLRSKPNVFLAIAPAIFAAWTSRLALTLVRALPTVLHVQDFEVEIAFKLRLLRGERARRLATYAESQILRSYDRVFAPSEAMVAKLREKGCRLTQVSEFRNWVDLSKIRPDVSSLALRNEIGIEKGKKIALYAGNISEKQGASIILDAARIIPTDANVEIIICGDGSAKEAISRGSKGLANVTLLPLQPVSRVAELLCMADVHLLPQLANAEDLVLPSKLAGMMSSGRPTIATVNADSGIHRMIGDAGIITPPGSAVDLALAIQKLMADDDLRAEMGRKARQRAEAVLSQDKILEQFKSLISDMIA